MSGKISSYVRQNIDLYIKKVYSLDIIKVTICLIRKFFAFTGTSVQASPRGWKKHVILLLINYDNILKKKDANVQIKLTSFYILEKDRKFGAYPQRLGLNIFGEF